MSKTNNNHDLFSASLESIVTSKRVEKFQRFKNDFQRECNATLDNAQEWIKAELPIATDHIDATAIKNELKQNKSTSRRKHLLSALLFEKSLRESITNNNAPTAAIMAMHMFNHMWQAKIELHASLPVAVTSTNTNKSSSQITNESYDNAREIILTSLIEKGEKLKKDSQIAPKIQVEPTKSKHVYKVQDSVDKNSSANTQRKVDTWVEEVEKDKQWIPFLVNKKQTKKEPNNKPKKKSGSLLSKVKTKSPLKRRKKSITDKFISTQPDSPKESLFDYLLDDPNRSSIMVNPGFSDTIDDSLIQEHKQSSRGPNDSAVIAHKMLKAHDHERQDPGSNTIIMKLASSIGKRIKEKLSLPEQCQQAINVLTEQFPGYDLVAIRNMAAEKVGVSPQYIENLNVLPEKTGCTLKVQHIK